MSHSFPYQHDTINDKYSESVGHLINDSETIGRLITVVFEAMLK